MGPVAQQVFKTCAVWQPHARSVRLRRRSVKPFVASATGRGRFQGGAALRRCSRLRPAETARRGGGLWQGCGVKPDPGSRGLVPKRRTTSSGVSPEVGILATGENRACARGLGNGRQFAGTGERVSRGPFSGPLGRRHSDGLVGADGAVTPRKQLPNSGPCSRHVDADAEDPRLTEKESAVRGTAATRAGVP